MQIKKKYANKEKIYQTKKYFFVLYSNWQAPVFQMQVFLREGYEKLPRGQLCSKIKHLEEINENEKNTVVSCCPDAI